MILTYQVKDSISKELPKKNFKNYGLETEIINLKLIKKGGNEYAGILTTRETRTEHSDYHNDKNKTYDEFDYEYDVNVLSDGEKYVYYIEGKREKLK
jgi:hypothetical protein